MGNPEDVWQAFGRHLIGYRAADLTAAARRAPGWFAVLTGIPDIELNVTALHPPAGRPEAEALVALVDAVDTPALVFVSSVADPSVRAVLAGHGFTATTTPEPLMWRPGAAVPPLAESPFAVRRVASTDDLAGLEAILEAGITMPPEVTRTQFALERLDGDGLASWVAWDGDDPASTVTLHWDAAGCSVFEMMSMPAHRRRGAGRAVLAAALADVLRPTMTGTVLVSTPLGRPLYESLGFAAVDEATTWTRGASAEDLARVGQTMAVPG